MKRNLGMIAIFILLLNTFTLWALSKENLGFIIDSPLLATSQILSLFGIVLISVSFVLTTRLRFVEKLFGGLDKVYKVHHAVAGIGFIFLLNHPISLALNVLPLVDLALKYFLPFENSLSYNLGIFSLSLFSLLIFVTFFIKLPYHIWKFTHNFMGVAMIVGTVHIFLIKSDISNYLPLRIWILGICSAAIFSVVYSRFLYKYLSKTYEYKIVKINEMHNVIEVYMKPDREKMNYRSGQIVFLSFRSKFISREKHPFSISSNPQDEMLRVSVKKLGDYTKTLGNLGLGDMAEIQGPFGSFSEKFYIHPKRDVIFIAGGIGVTPFLGMIKSPKIKDRSIHMFYCVRNEKDSVYAVELEDAVSKLENFHLSLHLSDKGNRVNVSKIEKIAGGIKDKIIFICGPKGMMESLGKQLFMAGVKSKNIVFEDFEIK